MLGGCAGLNENLVGRVGVEEVIIKVIILRHRLLIEAIGNS
jgi:hypothetical protein